MSDFLAALTGAFLPLFVAVNIPGILPLFIGMTEGMTTPDRQRLLVRALLAALSLAVLMLFAGELIFRTLGISVDDLRVGGGLILLVISVSDLAFGDLKRRRTDADDDDQTPEVGPVPLGIPLIIGPGAITTILVAQGQYSYAPTLLSIVANLALVFVAFTFGPALMRLVGPSASKAVAKVASLFLAAIAVAMIRAGIAGMLG